MTKITFILIFIFSAFANASDSATASGKTPVPTGKYVTGGVLASTIGLGIGHAVQGRYEEKGWIFTAGEVGGLALLISADCRNRDNPNEDRCTSPGAAVIGFGTLLGFHIWEVVDAWAQATPVDSEPKNAFMVVPTHQGTALAWTRSF